MPVRFNCHNCRQLLSVSRRKIGADIQCPKCGKSMCVPGESEGAAVVSKKSRSRRSKGTQSASEGEPPPGPDEADDAPLFPELVVFDEPGARPTAGAAPSPPEGNGSPSTAATVAPPQAPEPSTDVPHIEKRRSRSIPAPARSPSVSRLTRRAGGGQRIVVRPDAPMLLVSRKVIYLQGLLFVALGLFTFGVGYLIGRGAGPAQSADKAQQPEADTVLVEGTLSYVGSEGRPMPDKGAVVIALPKDVVVERKIVASDLSPLDPEPQADNRGVLSIEELGGAYARTDERGIYSIVVPRAGKYHLLFISHGSQRPLQQGIDPKTLEELQRVFQPVTGLVRQQKYHWIVQDISGGSMTKGFDFGPTGK